MGMAADTLAVVPLFATTNYLSFPGFYEEILCEPIILEKENATNLYQALLGGGKLTDEILEHIKVLVGTGKVLFALLLFVADSAKANIKLWTYIIVRVSGDRILLWYHRCDGHQWHLVVDKLMKRSGVQAPLFSMCHLLRAVTHKNLLSGCVRDLIFEEMLILEGCQPTQDNRLLARAVLLKTFLRNQSARPDHELSEKQRKKEHAQQDRAYAAIESCSGTVGGQNCGS